QSQRSAGSGATPDADALSLHPTPEDWERTRSRCRRRGGQPGSGRGRIGRRRRLPMPVCHVATGHPTEASGGARASRRRHGAPTHPRRRHVLAENIEKLCALASSTRPNTEPGSASPTPCSATAGSMKLPAIEKLLLLAPSTKPNDELGSASPIP